MPGEKLYVPDQEFVVPKFEVPTFRSQDYAKGIERYLETGQAQQTLRPYQMEVFRKFQDFFAGDYRRGFVTMPTGTGKTVLFVELSKALMYTRNNNGDAPKILVTSPLKDLVVQTLGRPGTEDEKARGYGGFAPELRVGTFYSDTELSEKKQEHLMTMQVMLTTYKSLRKLANAELLRRMTPAERNDNLRVLLSSAINKHGGRFDNFDHEYIHLYTQLNQEERISYNRSLLSVYNVHILDEGHNILGPNAADIVENDIPADAQVIAFTASPNADRRRTIKKYLPRVIHDLQIKQAVSMELLAPLVPLAVSSNNKITGDDILDETGDFIQEKIMYLARSEKRNNLIVKMAKIFVDQEIGTVINCIQGDDAWHPTHIAKTLRDQGIRAEAIHHMVPPKQRAEHYKAFEHGEIDVLTYIGILAEGWDSDRAKALINGRPTRSRIIAIQRLGRVLRPGMPAFAVDVVDRLDSVNPTFSVADIFDEGDITQGTILGAANEVERLGVMNVIRSLGKVANLHTQVRADHNRFDAILAEYPDIEKGNLMDALHGSFKVANAITQHYRGVNEKVVEAAAEQQGVELTVRLGNQNSTLIKTYHVQEVNQLLASLPETDPEQFYTDSAGNWIADAGMPQAFPGLTIQRSAEILEELSTTHVWQIARSLNTDELRGRHGARYRLHKIFLIDDAFIADVKAALGRDSEQL